MTPISHKEQPYTVQTYYFKSLLIACVIGLLLAEATGPLSAEDQFAAEHRLSVAAMKESDRGPFSAIRWFCNDGEVLPANTGCRNHGGGRQHGEWSPETLRLREAGLPIATIYSQLTPADFDEIRRDPERLAALLVERFLIAADDGWVFRKARFYRGAFQIEDEAPAAEDLLLHLMTSSKWRESRYLLLREATRLLPRARNHELMTEIRAEARELATTDAGFIPLRNKLHAYPESEDAARIRAWAIKRPASLRARYHSLAAKLDEAYSPNRLTPLLHVMREQPWDTPADEPLKELIQGLLTSQDLAARIEVCGDALLFLRERFLSESNPALLLNLLDASLIVEREFFRLREFADLKTEALSRRRHLSLVEAGVKAAYGAGLLSKRSYFAARSQLEDIQEDSNPSISEYQEALKQLLRLPGWAAERMEVEFGAGIKLFNTVEPLAAGLTADRLKGSPLIFLADELSLLSDDAGSLAGRTHRVFGQEYKSGLRALNPGIASGRLVSPSVDGSIDAAPSRLIYFVPETTFELPPAAGILTLNEGNVLSHVQLLARNLGIPNVVIDKALLPQIEQQMGKNIVLAASPNGSVLIAEKSAALSAELKLESSRENLTIRPDLDKLDLDETSPISLKKLKAKHSGRIVGPKAARLGDLKKHFPEQVADGLAIPFGVFAEALQQMRMADHPLPDWMAAQYRSLQALPPDSPLYGPRLRDILQRIRHAIRSSRLSPEFTEELREALQKEFGPDGSYGVFVRSDTNVEDSGAFSGAGLNLTVPNVKGFNQIARAVLDVWASPFTLRAFMWRQAHMQEPEHVYSSVLIMKSVPSEKSGVMITSDIDTGSSDYITVAANEGVAGAVNNQSAETLRISLADGEVSLLSEAGATEKSVIAAGGGILRLPARKGERVLSTEELAALLSLARRLPQEFPELEDSEGEPVPADVEFGFFQGKLALFQIRPFLNSRKARESSFLAAMDSAVIKQLAAGVNLNLPPLLTRQATP